MLERILKFSIEHRWLVVLLAVSFEPFLFECWIGGQLSAVAFFSYALCYYFLKKDKPLLAGVVLGICFYKPTLLLLMVPMLLAGRQWLMLAGMTLTGLFYLTLSLLMVGWENPFDTLAAAAGGVRDRVWRVGAGDGLDRRQQRVADDGHAGPRVVEDVAVVRRLPQRVDRYRHRADLDGAEERVEKRRLVQQEEHDPLPRPDATGVAQRAAAAIDALGEFGVGDPLVAAFNRDSRAAPLGEMPVDEKGRRVEPVGNAKIRGRLHASGGYFNGE
jgi:hypothetical protein